MKLIETYKKVINHQTGYTLIGEEAFAELNYQMVYGLI